MIDIFVPVYNEGKNIKALFDDIQEKVNSEFRLIIVYDADEDNTIPVIKEIKDNYNFEIQLEKNHYGRGALNAVKTGIESAKSKYWVFTMADLSDSIETINIMKEKIDEGYDVVCGSRYIKGGAVVGGPKLKRLLSRCSAIGMRIAAGVPVHDITNGFKMYRTSVLKSVEIESTHGFEIILEIFLKCYLNGAKITEVPAKWYDRTEGKSNFKMWDWIPHYLYWCFYTLKNKRKIKKQDGKIG